MKDMSQEDFERLSWSLKAVLDSIDSMLNMVSIETGANSRLYVAVLAKHKHAATILGNVYKEMLERFEYEHNRTESSDSE